MPYSFEEHRDHVSVASILHLTRHRVERMSILSWIEPLAMTVRCSVFNSLQAILEFRPVVRRRRQAATRLDDGQDPVHFNFSITIRSVLAGQQRALDEEGLRLPYRPSGEEALCLLTTREIKRFNRNSISRGDPSNKSGFAVQADLLVAGTDDRRISTLIERASRLDHVPSCLKFGDLGIKRIVGVFCAEVVETPGRCSRFHDVGPMMRRRSGTGATSSETQAQRTIPRAAKGRLRELARDAPLSPQAD